MCFLLSNIFKSYYLLKGLIQFAECLNSTEDQKLNDPFLLASPKYLPNCLIWTLSNHLFRCVFFSLTRNRNTDEIQANWICFPRQKYKFWNKVVYIKYRCDISNERNARHWWTLLIWQERDSEPDLFPWIHLYCSLFLVCAQGNMGNTFQRRKWKIALEMVGIVEFRCKVDLNVSHY